MGTFAVDVHVSAEKMSNAARMASHNPEDVFQKLEALNLKISGRVDSTFEAYFVYEAKQFFKCLGRNMKNAELDAKIARSFFRDLMKAARYNI